MSPWSEVKITAVSSYAPLSSSAAEHRAELTRPPAGAASRSSRGGAASLLVGGIDVAPAGRAAGPSATAAARRACRAGRRRSSPAGRRTPRRSRLGEQRQHVVVLPLRRARAPCRRGATSSGCDSPYQGWSIGNHITSCGFTSATVRNHGSVSVAALARSHDAASSRDDRVEVHAGAGPAHEVLVVALPVGEAVRGPWRAEAAWSSATCRCSSTGSRRHASMRADRRDRRDRARVCPGRSCCRTPRAAGGTGRSSSSPATASTATCVSSGW